MRKGLLGILSVLAISTLVGCNKNDGNTVYFNYNLPDNSSTYLAVTYHGDETVHKPVAPEAEDKVFVTWTTDKDGEHEYVRWGLAIDKSITLYAKWEEYASLSIDKKVEFFNKKLQSLSKDVSQEKEDLEGVVGYPFQGEEAVFSVKEHYERKRYTDLTDDLRYTYDEDDRLVKYAEEQFYYDNNYMYDILVNDMDPTQSRKSRAAYDKNKINGLLSIDYVNLWGSIQNNLVAYAISGKYDEETFEYEFDINPTKIDIEAGVWQYKLGYRVSNYATELGDYVTQICEIEVGLIFEYGQIARANVYYGTEIYLGQEFYEFQYLNSICKFYYNNGQFPTFTGTRLPY